MGAVISAILLTTVPASAVTTWTDWSRLPVGMGGFGFVIRGEGISYTADYSGEVDRTVFNGTSPIWAPNSSFIGGTSTASPSTVGDAIFLNGSFTGTNIISFFGSPVVNPVFAIWSLGAPGAEASLNFNATPTFEAGGPNSQFGGLPITVSGNTVSGTEGNGVVQFTGTFSSLSWTTTIENFYGFTVGVSDAGEETTPVPEPSTIMLLGVGLAGLGLAWRRKTN